MMRCDAGATSRARRNRGGPRMRTPSWRRLAIRSEKPAAQARDRLSSGCRGSAPLGFVGISAHGSWLGFLALALRAPRSSPVRAGRRRVAALPRSPPRSRWPVGRRHCRRSPSRAPPPVVPRCIASACAAPPPASGPLESHGRSARRQPKPLVTCGAGRRGARRAKIPEHCATYRPRVSAAGVLRRPAPTPAPVLSPSTPRAARGPRRPRAAAPRPGRRGAPPRRTPAALGRFA